jgi:hypothetical protein
MRWFVPIIGESAEVKRTNALLSTELAGQELARMLDNDLQINKMLKIGELRRSCGVKDEMKYTVNVRTPPRYQK